MFNSSKSNSNRADRKKERLSRGIVYACFLPLFMYLM